MDEQKREYKRKYVRRFGIVQSIINQWDPIGLFPGDAAPFNEYEPEIAQIVALLDKNDREPSSLAEGIQGVFLRWFGDDMAPPMEECRKVASKILEAMYGDWHL